MRDVTIRVGTAADVAVLHGLIERAYRGDTARDGWTHEADLLGGQRTDVAELNAIVADLDKVLLIAEQDGTAIGSVFTADQGEGLAYMGMLAIEPGLQRGGLGRRLIAAVEAEAVTRFGATRMRMTVIKQRPELIAYYERRGYVLTGTEEPFPMNDARFGLPQRQDLVFVVLEKAL